MQSQANPTITAIVQLVQFGIVIAGVVVLAVTHTIPSTVVAALGGQVIAHSGIIAYNGATKGAPRNGS